MLHQQYLQLHFHQLMPVLPQQLLFPQLHNMANMSIVGGARPSLSREAKIYVYHT